MRIRLIYTRLLIASSILLIVDVNYTRVAFPKKKKKNTREVNSSHDRNDSRISTEEEEEEAGEVVQAASQTASPLSRDPVLRNSLFWSASHQQQPDRGGGREEGRNRYMAAITTATMPEPCARLAKI